MEIYIYKHNIYIYYTCIYIYVYVYTCTNICVCVCVCVCVCMHAFIYTQRWYRQRRANFRLRWAAQRRGGDLIWKQSDGQFQEMDVCKKGLCVRYRRGGGGRSALSHVVISDQKSLRLGRRICGTPPSRGQPCL